MRECRIFRRISVLVAGADDYICFEIIVIKVNFLWQTSGLCVRMYYRLLCHVVEKYGII